MLLICVGLFAALAQDRMYGDGAFLLASFSFGDALHPVHILYFPLLRLASLPGELLGLTLYETALSMSVCGAAVGVALHHSACLRLGASRCEAILVAGMIATCPAIVFFATVVEVHAAFFAFVGLVAIAVSVAARRPDLAWGGAVGVGLATSLSALAHASGAALILPAVLLVWAFHSAATWRQRIAFGTTAGVVHASLMIGVSLSLDHLDRSASAVRVFIRQDPEPLLEHALATIWWEWIAAFGPIAVCWVFAFHRDRRVATVVIVSLAAYLLTCFAILREPEHGAYLLPLAFPTALVTARAMPRRVAVAVLAGGAAFAVAGVLRHDVTATQRDHVQRARNTFGDSPVLLLVDSGEDMETRFVFMPDLPVYPVELPAGVPVAELEVLLPDIESSLHKHFAAGVRVFLTAGAVRYLEDPSRTRNHSGPAVLRFLETRFRLVAPGADGMLAYELLPR